jgi:integrase
VKKKAPHFDPIRHDFPPVTWRADKNRFMIDARAKGGPRQYRTDRAEALALAEKLAAEFDSKGRSAFAATQTQAEALKNLGLTSNEAIALFLQAHAPKSGTTPLGDAFDQFKAHKLQEGLSAITLSTMLPQVERFVAALGRHTTIGSITLDQLLVFLAAASNPSTFNTRRKHLVSFFSDCQRHKLIAENPALLIKKQKVPVDIRILTPEEAQRLLLGTYTAFSDPAIGSSMRAYYALSLFAGVRPDEIKKLRWSDITLFPSAPRTVEWTHLDLDKGDSLFVSEKAAKTKEARSVPIFPNLREWLLTCPDRTGPVIPDVNNSLMLKGRCSAAFKYRFDVSRKKAGFARETWPKDVLRHCYGSYLLALTHNRAQLATLMGNSEDVIRSHYRRHVSSDAATAFFSIMPPGAH